MAVGKPADGARDAGRWNRDQGLGQPGRGDLAQPRTTSTDLAQLPLDQPGRAPSANLGQLQPTSTKSAEGPSKCSESSSSTSSTSTPTNKIGSSDQYERGLTVYCSPKKVEGLRLWTQAYIFFPLVYANNVQLGTVDLPYLWLQPTSRPRESAQFRSDARKFNANVCRYHEFCTKLHREFYDLNKVGGYPGMEAVVEKGLGVIREKIDSRIRSKYLDVWRDLHWCGDGSLANGHNF
ncbi:hypothetical protein B0H19DRAFT_1317468 [Mycena capillaripes]|nr:hypothetical protein B0H19DRAFT_1317468 [Mycena capillaripes]